MTIVGRGAFSYRHVVLGSVGETRRKSSLIPPLLVFTTRANESANQCSYPKQSFLSVRCSLLGKNHKLKPFASGVMFTAVMLPYFCCFSNNPSFQVTPRRSRSSQSRVDKQPEQPNAEADVEVRAAKKARIWKLISGRRSILLLLHVMATRVQHPIPHYGYSSYTLKWRGWFAV